MNIQEAKEQIKNTIVAYFSKDEEGEYIFPIEKQRPIFMMGPPGIGKTAIMEQIASEMGVGLLSYPMTHHTRQSVLGLSFVTTKEYDGISYNVTEYTMSEIMASIYDFIRDTNVKEGILFLDEINCVEESLQAVMLQFLQSKVLGKYRIPDGWVVVTAGNPPEYNESGRDFDIVTWDRLKRIDIIPDFTPWQNYAYNKSVNQAIISYIEQNVLDFYRVETLTSGKITFVSARAWDDLSQMLLLNEINGIPSDKNLISQYIQNPRVASKFSEFYSRYNEYKQKYPISQILIGQCSTSAFKNAKDSEGEERFAICSILYSALDKIVSTTMHWLTTYKKLKDIHRLFNAFSQKEPSTMRTSLEVLLATSRTNYNLLKQSKSVSREELSAVKSAINLFNEECDYLFALELDNAHSLTHKLITSYLKNDLSDRRREFNNERVVKTISSINNVFMFIEKVFGEEEVFDLIDRLNMNPRIRTFIKEHDVVKYREYTKKLEQYAEQANFKKLS